MRDEKFKSLGGEVCSITKEKRDRDLQTTGDAVDCKLVMEAQRARAGAAPGLCQRQALVIVLPRHLEKHEHHPS